MSDSHYVPIEERWLGLDKRAIPYAVVMVALIALLAYVIPAINDAVGWDDGTRAGDVIDLGGGLTITPPVGWLLEDGIRTSDDPAVPVQPDNAYALLANGGISITVVGSGWDGSADELMDQANSLREDSDADDDKLFKVTGSRDSVTTSSGIVGVSETFTSATGDGKTFAFAVPADGDSQSVGVVITVRSAADGLAEYGAAIDTMVSSLLRGEQTP